MDDDSRINIQLARDDAEALIYVLDVLIEQDPGTGSGALLRGLHQALMDAFGGVKPDPPEGWPQN